MVLILSKCNNTSGFGSILLPDLAEIYFLIWQNLFEFLFASPISIPTFLCVGFQPVFVLENDKTEKAQLLKELKNSFLKKDIDESGIANPDKFYALLTLLAGQTGNLVNRNELANTIGVDNKTIDKYLYVLQNCFHAELVKPFFNNRRKELTKMPKLFFKDSGMRNIALNRLFDFRDREDHGQ